MPRELVLMSDRAPTSTDLTRAARTVLPDATILEWAEGTLRQVLDLAGQPLITVYTTRPVDDPTALPGTVDDPQPAAYWTDVTIPEPAQGVGDRIAHTLGGIINGTVTARI